MKIILVCCLAGAVGQKPQQINGWTRSPMMRITYICETPSARWRDHARGSAKNSLKPALFLTHLTIPSQFLQSFGFNSVGDCFRRQESSFFLAHCYFTRSIHTKSKYYINK